MIPASQQLQSSRRRTIRKVIGLALTVALLGLLLLVVA
jgi:hypothetical protein